MFFGLLVASAGIAAVALNDSADAQSGHSGHHGHTPPPKTSPTDAPKPAPAPKPHGHDDHGEAKSPAAKSPTSTPESSKIQDGDYRVETPGGRTDYGRVVEDKRVFHLTASEISHEFAPGLKATVWGYNGAVHGPTLVATKGETVRIYVTNRLAAPTTVHWHGFILPSGMDGVSGLNQAPINPGETFIYEFPLIHEGTFMYHSHYDEMTQMAMGLMGMFVVLPKEWPEGRPEREFVMLLSEWHIAAGASRPDTNAMDGFNILTINGKAYPETGELHAFQGEKVRIRMGNLSAMDHHPMHLHGNVFEVVATDGGAIPKSARWPETTVLMAVGTTRDIEFVASYEGDWAFHCHMTHHVMNQMGHGLPNMVGTNSQVIDHEVSALIPGFMAMGSSGMGGMEEHAEHMPTPANAIAMKGAKGPHGYIGMGGMFTILKVRAKKEGESFDGWYTPPAGTQARAATPEELARDLPGEMKRIVPHKHEGHE